MYLAYEQEMYKDTGKFITSYDFSKYINHLKKHDERYSWIKGYSSKAIKDAIINQKIVIKIL